MSQGCSIGLQRNKCNIGTDTEGGTLLENSEVEQVVGVPWVTAFCQLVIVKVQIGILRVTANFLKVQVQIVKKYKLLVCLL